MPPAPGPASGFTDFTPVGSPWTFSFQTSDPTTWSWSDFGLYYSATFGEGGYFDIAGPEGTFVGTVTSGWTIRDYTGLPSAQLEVNFQGQWSDGQYASGSAYMSYIEDIGVFQTSSLEIANSSTPEPTSMALFASGLLTLAGAAKRKLS